MAKSETAKQIIRTIEQAEKTMTEFKKLMTLLKAETKDEPSGPK